MINFAEYKELNEASYAGNIGIMELIKFYTKAKDNPEKVTLVKTLIKQGKNNQAWDEIEKFTGVKLNHQGTRL